MFSGDSVIISQIDDMIRHLVEDKVSHDTYLCLTQTTKISSVFIRDCFIDDTSEANSLLVIIIPVTFQTSKRGRK